jgi:hypothetical protein
MKYQCVLPFSMHQCLVGIFSKEFSLKLEPQLISVLTTKYLSFDDLAKDYESRGLSHKKYKRGLVCLQNVLNLPFPLNKRHMNCSCAFSYDPQTKSMLVVIKGYAENFSDFSVKKKTELPDKNGKMFNTEAYNMFSFGFFRLQKIGDNKVSFNHVSLMQVGGWTNNKVIFKKIATNRGLEARKTYMKFLKEIPIDITIKDFKESFLKINENGFPDDGFGKLLYETNEVWDIEN